MNKHHRTLRDWSEKERIIHSGRSDEKRSNRMTKIVQIDIKATTAKIRKVYNEYMQTISKCTGRQTMNQKGERSRRPRHVKSPSVMKSKLIMNSNFESVLLEYRWIHTMKTWHSSKDKGGPKPKSLRYFRATVESVLK